MAPHTAPLLSPSPGHEPLRAGQTRPRMLAYAFVLAPAAGPQADWDTLSAAAEQCGWVIGPRFHDVAVPAPDAVQGGSHASSGTWTAPWKRPGWAEVRRLLEQREADGVLVLDRRHISSSDTEVDAAINGLRVHFVVQHAPT